MPIISIKCGRCGWIKSTTGDSKSTLVHGCNGFLQIDDNFSKVTCTGCSISAPKIAWRCTFCKYATSYEISNFKKSAQKVKASIIDSVLCVVP